MKTYFALTQADLPGKEKLTDIPIDQIEPNNVKEFTFYVRAYRTNGERIIRVKVRIIFFSSKKIIN